jgi:parallel beta-helix repeat protein
MPKPLLTVSPMPIRAANVRTFGTVGHGVTDDAPAIQAAINSVAGAGGGIVLLPTGVYALSSRIFLASGVILQGEGASTILKVGNGSIYGAIRGTNVHDWAIRDLAIDLNKMNTVDGLSDSGQQAIYVVATTAAGIVRGRIERVSVTNGWRHGISLVSTDAVPATWPLDVLVTDCQVSSVGRIGIFVEKGNGTRIDGCEVQTCAAQGIYVQSSHDCRVTDCYAHGNGWHGIVFWRSTDFRVEGCRSNDNDVAQTHSNNSGIGIVASVNCQRFVISGNECCRNGGIGISLDVRLADNDYSQVPVDAVVNDNTCDGNRWSHGIYAQYLRGLTLIGNRANGNAHSGIYLVAAREVAVIGNLARANAVYGVGISEPTIESEGGTSPSGNIQIRGNALFDNVSGALGHAVGVPSGGYLVYDGKPV